MAAGDECNNTRSDCLWNNDKVDDITQWGARRHMGKVFELAQTFKAVFGAAAFAARVRPVFAWWAIAPQQFNSTLAWANQTYGPLSEWLYGIATTGYFGGSARANMSIDDALLEYAIDSAASAELLAPIHAIAAAYGVKVLAYEAGPGWAVGNTQSLGSYIMAHRMAPMRDILRTHVGVWAGMGPQMDAYNHFALVGKPSQSGMWGHAETFFNQSTPKWCAVLDATGTPLTPECNWTYAGA